jgi:hypothetical protein
MFYITGKHTRAAGKSQLSKLWYDVPPREFPAQRWVREQYGFRLPPLYVRPRDQPARREFPAKRWVRMRAVGGV